MLQPLSAFVAWRYATAGKHNSFISFINGFSVAGIALGLMALIIVLSVMNGFEGQLKQRILGIVPQVVAKHVQPETISALEIPEVKAVMPYREAEGVVQSREALRGVLMQGVDPQAMKQHSIVADNIVAGSFSLLREGDFNVIIGRALALELKVKVGDTMRLIAAGASVYTPLGRMPSQRLVVVAGTFSVGSQLDDKVVYMALGDMTRLLRMRASSTPDTRLFLHDAFNYQQVVNALSAENIESENWRSRQGPLFDAVKMEKNMMFLMLLLIIAVAAFNIVSALVMVVTEKQGDIAILQTQGMSERAIMAVFIFNGMFNGLKGAVYGLVLGLLAVWQLNNVLDLLGIHLALSADGRGLPVNVQWHQVVAVTLFALLLCFVASLYPARRALHVQPARALQND